MSVKGQIRVIKCFLENQGNAIFFEGAKIFRRGVGVMLSITMETQRFPYKSSIPFCVCHFCSFV